VKARCRPVRFSLAAMLIVVTGGTLWLGRTTLLARRQKAAVASITSAEGIVGYEETAIPPWLRDAIGEEYFLSAKSVDFATDMGRKGGSQEPKANDHALGALAGLQGLETLELGHNESVGDEQLKFLRPLKGLRVLYLHRTAVTGPGLKELVDLPHLEHLMLDRTSVGDEGAGSLGAMRGLRSLSMNHTQITDMGIGRLTRLRKLESLRLRNTAITDAAIPDLAKLESLTELVLKGTKITAEGAEQLKHALPNCSILLTFAVGKSPDDRRVAAPDEELTAADLTARFRERGIDGHASPPAGVDDANVSQLFLGHTNLSDAALVDLVNGQPALDTLTIRESLASNDFLAGLQGSKSLTYLELAGSLVTDDGLVHLAKFPNLRDLVLNSTDVTDEGLRHLEPLPSLRQLSLEDSRATPAGIKQLRAALPNCSVTY
jgi:hypothetical protein